jgi:hypothetical protein
VVNDDYDEARIKSDLTAWFGYAPTEELIQLLSKPGEIRRSFHRTLLAIRGLKSADVESWR